MKTIKTILLILIAALSLQGCQKDPLREVNDGDWNKERNILGITFNGQVGDAAIARDGDDASITFTYNTAISEDLSSIAITELEISYGATASVETGATLNFDNSDNSAVITITPANGDPLDWKITLIPFSESLLGTWNISGLYVYGGTGDIYGGTSLHLLTSVSVWNTATGPAAEMDNTLTFTLSGIDDVGNSYGTVVNNSGSDGLYADFVYIASDPDVDVNKFYRKVPTGTATWVHNYSAGTVIFTFADGSTSTATWVSSGSETLYGSIVKTTADYSFRFTLKGTDDWTHIYSAYDKLVSNPRVYWVDITKSK
jgi:hypothetical protein